MAASVWPVVPGDVSCVVSDGTGTPNTITLTRFLSGLSLNTKELRENVLIKARGERVGQRDGAVTETEITVEFVFTEATNGSADTIADFIHFRGNASSNVSTAGAGYERKATEWVFTMDKTTASKFHTSADSADVTITYAAMIPISEEIVESDDNTELRYRVTLQNIGAAPAVTGQA